MYTQVYTNSDTNMLAKVQKWGNSLGIRLPKKLAKAIQLDDGSYVDIIPSNNSLIIRLKEDPLDNLLNQVTAQNLHSIFFDEDYPQGKETW